MVHAPDECYFGSVLASIGFDFPARIHKLCLTHVNWDAPRRSHAHPYRYGLLKRRNKQTTAAAWRDTFTPHFLGPKVDVNSPAA